MQGKVLATLRPLIVELGQDDSIFFLYCKYYTNPF